MTGYNQRYHIRCVYRELQLPFIPFFSLSLAYVGNILVRRYRPLTTLLCPYFLYAYPAVLRTPYPYFSANLPYCALKFFFSCALIFAANLFNYLLRLNFAVLLPAGMGGRSCRVLPQASELGN